MAATLLDGSAPEKSWRDRAIAAGVASLATAALVCLAGAWMLRDGPATPAGALAAAVLYWCGVLAAAAGAGGFLLTFPERESDPAAWELWRRYLEVAAWIPPGALLAARGSWATLPILAVAGLLAARLPEQADSADDARRRNLFESPEPSPADRRRRTVSHWAALALCAGAVSGAADVPVASALALGLACALLAVMRDRSRREPRRTSASLSAVAFVATAVALLPSLGGGRFGEAQGEPPGPDSDRRFASVVLLADPRPEAEAENRIREPNLSPNLGAPPRKFSILFTGEYWYYFWPQSRPTDDALRKPGTPLTLRYTWRDQGRLIMRARQILQKPLDLGCCSAVEVALAGQEREPSTVSIELVVRNSVAGSKASLGVCETPADRNPTVRFALSEAEGLDAIDELDVVFHLESDVRRRSASLAVDRFDLIP